MAIWISDDGAFIKSAEAKINSIISKDSTWLAINNPDGTSLKLQPGFSFKFVQIISLGDKDNYVD